MVRRHCEHRTFWIRLWCFRIAWMIAFVIGLCSVYGAISGTGWKSVLGGAMAVFGLFGPVLLAATCARVFRPRMMVDGDLVRVYAGEFGTARSQFRWTDVRRWQVVVSPNEEESGPPEYQHIVVELAGRSSSVTLGDVGDEYISAFRELAPRGSEGGSGSGPQSMGLQASLKAN
ncbi:MAG: hypothetical protein U0840_27485 [Gemmataceae bacterium]